MTQNNAFVGLSTDPPFCLEFVVMAIEYNRRGFEKNERSGVLSCSALALSVAPSHRTRAPIKLIVAN